MAMLLLVMRTIDRGELHAAFAQVSLSTAVVVLLGYLVGQGLSAIKWYLLARAAGIKVPLQRALRGYALGMFVNNFGFGVLGGDVARAVILSQGQRAKSPAFASVLADRAHGLAVLALIGTISALVYGTTHQIRLSTELLWILGITVSSLVLGWFIGPPLVLRVLPRSWKFYDKIATILAVFPRSPRAVLLLSLLSALFHMSQITLHKVIGLGIGVDIPWHYLMVYVPLVNIFSTLPISWNGLGVREKSYTFFFTPTIMTGAQAVALGLVWLLAVTAGSALAGLVGLFTKDLELVRAPVTDTARSEESIQSQR